MTYPLLFILEQHYLSYPESQFFFISCLFEPNFKDRVGLPHWKVSQCLYHNRVEEKSE